MFCGIYLFVDADVVLLYRRYDTHKPEYRHLAWLRLSKLRNGNSTKQSMRWRKWRYSDGKRH